MYVENGPTAAGPPPACSSLPNVDGYNIILDGGGPSAGKRKLLARRASESGPAFFGDEQEQELVARIAAAADAGQEDQELVITGRQPLVVQVRGSVSGRAAALLRCCLALGAHSTARCLGPAE
jgi:hypothetical protein